jgi:hypothetical protein
VTLEVGWMMLSVMGSRCKEMVGVDRAAVEVRL